MKVNKIINDVVEKFEEKPVKYLLLSICGYIITKVVMNIIA